MNASNPQSAPNAPIIPDAAISTGTFASYWRRLGALVIDYIVVVVLAGVVCVATGALGLAGARGSGRAALVKRSQDGIAL